MGGMSLGIIYSCIPDPTPDLTGFIATRVNREPVNESLLG
jgi:hypothetical protein